MANQEMEPQDAASMSSPDGMEEVGGMSSQEGMQEAAGVSSPNAAQGAVSPEFAELRGQPNPAGRASLQAIYGLTLPVSIEIGRTRMTVQEILALGRGSVIQLDRLAGEPMDVYVGERRFAEGEVVVIGEQFGVRITRVLDSSAERETQA